MARGVTLPDERAASRRPSDLFRFVACLILMLACANGAVRAYLNRSSPNFGYAVIRDKWEVALHMRRSPSTLALGDSSCLHGFDAGAAAEILGGDAYNLCTIGDALVANSAAMLQRIVREAEAPKRAFVVHSYDVWHREHSGYVIAQAPLSLREARREFWFLDWDRELTLEWLTDRFLPLVAENESVLAGAKGLALRRSRANKMRRVDAFGFLPIENPSPEVVRKDIEAHRALLRTARPRISAANLGGLKTLVQLADRSQLDLTISFGPVVEDLARDPTFIAYLAGLTLLIEREIGGHRNVRLSPHPLRSFPAEQMENVDHLVLGAARRWTVSLVQESAGARDRGQVPRNLAPSGEGRGGPL